MIGTKTPALKFLHVCGKTCLEHEHDDADLGHLIDKVGLVDDAYYGRTKDKACDDLSYYLRGMELTGNDAENLCGKQNQCNIY